MKKLNEFEFFLVCISENVLAFLEMRSVDSQQMLVVLSFN